MRSKSNNFPLLPRKKNTSKADYGHALIVAGSRHMPGAAALSVEACLRSGAGWVTLAAPKSAASLVLRKIKSEALFLPLPETKTGSIALSAERLLKSYIRRRKINVMAIGPGLTRDVAVAALVRRLVRATEVPVVLDADGLNAFEGRAAALKEHQGPLVLTPHAKEFERVFSVACPVRDPARAVLAKKLARLYDVTIVLKGHRTLVTSKAYQYQNNTGNPGMAKGGSGDVLTGMVAAFIAQGLTPFEAARWAVYFHGKAGDLAVKEKGELGLLASDCIEFLHHAF